MSLQRKKLSHEEWQRQFEARHPRVAPFRCAICEREIADDYFRNGPDRHIEPVCQYCERVYTERTGFPKAGSMKDRRKAMQILALSNALHNRASIIEWEAKHGRS